MWKRSLVLCPLVLTACVLSLEPVVPESAAMTDERLLGAWEEVGGAGRIAVSRAGTTGYTIEYTDGDSPTGRFESRLGRLGRRIVLDLRPVAQDSGRASPEIGALIRGHVLFTVEFAGDSVRLAALQPDTFRAALLRGIVRLPHVANEDELVLTGTTAELSRALGPYLDRPGALDPQGTWRRVARTSPTVAAPAGPAPAAAAPQPDACFQPSPWPEADLLFHRDPHWVGSDGASTVDLGGGRTLWLFGDTWIDPSGRGTRRGATMVSNTVAIQRGADPARAPIAFYWGRSSGGGPAAYFPNRGEERLWLGNGVRVDDRLVLFLNRIRSANAGLGFQSVGWTAFMVENPDAEPSEWRVIPLDTPANPLGVIVGYAAVLRLGDYVYAFGSEDPVKSHPVYAVRWPAAAVRRGDLLQPEWWTGARLGWVPDSSSEPRWPLFENGSSDLTLHFDQASGQFLVVQHVGFGPADVMVRTAPELTGPWTASRFVYRPPEYDRPNVMIYSAKAHPELTGADLIVTYATNTFRFAEHLTDSLIYYPRFVRLMRCR